MATVADVLARTIRQAGIDTVFGLPGGENAEVLDALRRQGLAFVLVRDERSAVFMADATARLTGRPGVALTTLGPGATNAYCGVAHAYLDRAPVLLITAQSDGRKLDKYTHQVVDLQASFRPVTKMTRELTGQETRATLEEALRLTMSGRPGPVHLGVSSYTAGREVDEEGGTSSSTSPGAQEDGPDLKAARAFLRRARRPVIVAGLGLEPERPYGALRDLAEALQAPVIVTPKAKGAFPDDHPLSAGTFGLTGYDPPYEVADEADCIVAVGFDVVEMESLWDQPQPMLWIAPWANEDPQLPTVEVEVVGPLAPALEQIAAFAAANYEPEPGWGQARIRAYREREALKAARLPEAAPGRVRPQTVFEVLRHYIPREAVVTTDTGSHKIAMALTWPAYIPNTYLLSNGLSSMGYGVPAAIAAARVTGQATLCVTGDGGLAMALGELGLLAELGLPVIVVVMNDNALDLIRSGQQRRGKAVFGTEFANPDYEAVARGFGLAFYRVTDREACTSAAREAVAGRRPTLIEAMIDPISYPTTPS